MDSDSDTDSDPFEDPTSDEDSEDAVTMGEVKIYDDDNVDASDQNQSSDPDSHVHNIQTHAAQQTENRKTESVTIPKPSPKRRPPPPPPATSLYELKWQSWRENRPVLIKETAIEVEEDD